MICDIVIAVWNRKALTVDCIESIIARTSFPYRIVAIDNGSDEETRDYLAALTRDSRCDVRLIRNETNLGNTLAGNQGMRYSDADFVCNLDNDTVVTAGWLSELVAVAQQDERIGLVTSCAEGMPQAYTPEAVAAWAEERKQFCGDALERGVATGFCCLIKRRVIESIGVWDEAFSPGYFEDTEYSLRAKKHGFLSVAARGVCVYHREQASFKARFPQQQIDELFKRNRTYLYSKYERPKRALFVISTTSLSDMRETVYRIVDIDGWAHILSARVLADTERFHHANILYKKTTPFLLGLQSMWWVLTKKKKYDEVYIEPGFLAGVLRMCAKIRRIKVVSV